MRYDIDPVIEEIRETRRKLFEKCGKDPYKYGNYIAGAAAQRKALLSAKKKAKAV